MTPIHKLLKQAYDEYAKERGVAPTKFSIWIGYQNELSDYYTQFMIGAQLPSFHIDSDTFSGIPIKWINRRRIECLPRRKYKWSFWGSMAKIQPMSGPAGQVFYLDKINI